MSKRNDLLLLNDILDSIVTIEEYLHGFSDADFYKDRKTKDAVVRNFEIIGEASRQISQELKLLHPEIEWRKVSDLRNRIIHEYFGIDYVIIWEIIELDMPSLKKSIQALINHFPTN